MLRTYQIRYGIVEDPFDISQRVLVWGNPGFTPSIIPGHGSRPVKPNMAMYRTMEERGQFYTKLEASILEEGIKNPIFCNAYEQGTFCRYGTSRLWIAQKHRLKVPVIICDYVAKWKHFEELQDHEDIQKYYDHTVWSYLEEKEMTITPVPPDTNAKEFIIDKNKTDELRDREREKYEKVWSIPAYRKASPGEHAANDFLLWAKPSSTVVDLGCGTGRASLTLANRHKMTLVDLAENCRDSRSKHLPFIQQCLWDLHIPPQDYAFCCDVLEHIPEEKVDDVLDGIKKHCKKAYLRIFLKKDSGKFVDEPLHLTVKPAEWWEEKIRQRWDIVDTHATENVATFKAQ